MLSRSWSHWFDNVTSSSGIPIESTILAKMADVLVMIIFEIRSLNIWASSVIVFDYCFVVRVFFEVADNTKINRTSTRSNEHVWTKARSSWKKQLCNVEADLYLNKIMLCIYAIWKVSYIWICQKPIKGLLSVISCMLLRAFLDTAMCNYNDTTKDTAIPIIASDGMKRHWITTSYVLSSFVYDRFSIKNFHIFFLKCNNMSHGLLVLTIRGRWSILCFIYFTRAKISWYYTIHC